MHDQIHIFSVEARVCLHYMYLVSSCTMSFRQHNVLTKRHTTGRKQAHVMQTYHKADYLTNNINDYLVVHQLRRHAPFHNTPLFFRDGVGFALACMHQSLSNTYRVRDSHESLVVRCTHIWIRERNGCVLPWKCYICITRACPVRVPACPTCCHEGKKFHVPTRCRRRYPCVHTITSQENNLVSGKRVHKAIFHALR